MIAGRFWLAKSGQPQPRKKLVGLWRSARRHGPFAGVVVPLLIVAVVAHFAYPFAKGFAPAFTESFNAQYELSRQADSDEQ